MRIANGDTKRMQNELKTSTTGTVTVVHVQEGATVETEVALIPVVAIEACRGLLRSGIYPRSDKCY